MKEIEWNDFSFADKKCLIDQFAKLLKSRDKDTLLRIFNLAQPVIVLEKVNDQPQCHIKKENLPVIELLIKTYVKV